MPASSAAAMSFVNLRDVGALPVAGGRRVVAGRLYRSDAPLPGDREPDLRPWPPRTVVDLRSPGEAAAAEHPLASATTSVHHLPLARRLDPARMAQREDTEVVDLPGIYRGLVRAVAPRLVEVVALAATAPGPVLVHCAAGKDRTGIAVAVTLVAAGVLPEAVIADYERTEEVADALPDRVARGWAEADRAAMVHRWTVERPELVRAPAAAIEVVLDELERWPGGSRRWLLDHGLTPDALGALRERLTEPA